MVKNTLHSVSIITAYTLHLKNEDCASELNYCVETRGIKTEEPEPITT